MLMPRLPGRSMYLLLLLLLGVGVAGCGTASKAALIGQDGPAVSAFSRARPPTPVLTPTPMIGPQRLVIPSIKMDAPVEDVGILPNGDLQTPSKSPWVDTGWYDGGPEPGQQGSAVIDGHLDQPGGYAAVFWFLRDLKAGDDVEVIAGDGSTLHFRVTDVEYYQPQKAPLQQIFGDTSGKYLNLITCAGDWIPSQQQTTLRLVVYTKLVE